MAEPSQDQLMFLLSAGTVSILLLVTFTTLFFFIYQKRMVIASKEKLQLETAFQQQMVYTQLDSQEKERIRIASDLHDSLGSLLWSAKVNATFIEHSVPLIGETKESHRELMLSLDESINMVRRIAWELTPEAFQHLGFSQSLDALCKNLDKKTMDVVFTQEGDLFWKDERALQVYRIVQELISNCIKHAKATELRVNLTWRTSVLILTVEDNGIGFNLKEARKGVGWWNIEQRASLLKAKITAGKTYPDCGTSVVLAIPLDYEKK